MMSGVKKHVEFKHSKVKEKACHTNEYGIAESKKGITSVITLGDGCFSRESVIHEMLHALGFLHEHQRIDRNCYVVVSDEFAQINTNLKIISDDFVFEKWPYDKRSITHYKRMDGILWDREEPFGGLFFGYRLGDSYGWWGFEGERTGKMTFLDTYKINFRFCGAPDFCETQSEMCKQTEEEEKQAGCKDLYLDIAKGKVKPSKQ